MNWYEDDDCNAGNHDWEIQGDTDALYEQCSECGDYNDDFEPDDLAECDFA